MHKVRKATAEDVVSIRDVATKAWYNTYLNIYAAKTVNELLAASGTLYLYSLMPSNENPSGIMGQLTNIWVDEKYRHQGIASRIVSDLLTKGQGKCGMICLNSSKDAIALYQKLGFKTKERYMIKQWD